MRRCYQWDNIDKKVDIWIRKTKEDTNLIGPVRYPHTYNDLVKSNLGGDGGGMLIEIVHDYIDVSCCGSYSKYDC